VHCLSGVLAALDRRDLSADYPDLRDYGLLRLATGPLPLRTQISRRSDRQDAPQPAPAAQEGVRHRRAVWRRR
jgi:hypothetical protein